MTIHPQWLNLTQLFARSNYRGRGKGSWTLGSQWLHIAAGWSQSASETELCTPVDATYGGNAGTKVAVHDATD
jgi:hypothetical protein